MIQNIYLVFIALWITSGLSSNVETVADGFVWAENLVCDPKRSVFWVSDSTLGTLSKVSYNTKENRYETVPHISDVFEGMAGLAMNSESNVLFAAATIKNGTTAAKEFVVVKVDMEQPNTYQIVATLPESGNGVAMDWSSGLLYVTTEGNFKPRAGQVFEIDPATGEVRDYVTNLYAADGAYIDQKKRLLYVSQVIGSKVIVYDLSWTAATSPLREFSPQDITMLDDFTLSADSTSIIAADFREGKVVSFSLEEGSSPATTLLAGGLTSTTSARLGCGLDSSSPFPSSSVFVTEGGGLTKRANTRRVLKIEL